MKFVTFNIRCDFGQDGANITLPDVEEKRI